MTRRFTVRRRRPADGAVSSVIIDATTSRPDGSTYVTTIGGIDRRRHQSPRTNATGWRWMPWCVVCGPLSGHAHGFETRRQAERVLEGHSERHNVDPGREVPGE